MTAGRNQKKNKRITTENVKGAKAPYFIERDNNELQRN